MADRPRDRPHGLEGPGIVVYSNTFEQIYDFTIPKHATAAERTALWAAWMRKQDEELQEP